VSNFQYQDNDSIVLKAADEAVVLNSVAPQARQVSAQGFTESPWVFRASEALPQVAKDFLLDFGVELA
jgi:hypothetical protein